MRSSGLKAGLAAAVFVALVGCGQGAGAQDPEAARAAAEFMAANARAEGVRTLPSGVQYKVVREGEAGAPSPDSNDEVSVHYEGTLVDGTVFDSSYQRGVPATFALDGLIPAWEEAIPHMSVGDEWLLYVPPEQGYGAEGSPPEIPPHSVLVFRIELLGVAPVPGGESPNRAQG